VDRRTGLWRNPGFLTLWGGRTVSTLGSQVTQVALPLTAVLVLQATPLQMGVLRAVAATPDVALGFVAGAWVDRVRRRPLLVGTELCQALVVGSVPIAALLGALHLQQLYVVAPVSAALALTFDVAAQAYVPALVGDDDLAEGNSRLAISGSLSRLIGPALGGGLVQLLTAPLAIAADSLSFLLSAVALGSIRAEEPAAESPSARPGALELWTSVARGLRFVVENRTVLALAGSAGLFNLFDGVVFAVYILFATRQLAIPPAVLGTIIAAGGAGGLLGAVAAGRAARHLGTGRALLGAMLVATAGELLIAFAGGPVGLAAALLLVAEVLVGLGAAVFGVNYLTLRQLVTPAPMQGRVHATSRAIVSGLGPLGALAGGVLGQAAGLRAPLIVGALGTLSAAALLLASPVRSSGPHSAPAMTKLT